MTQVKGRRSRPKDESGATLSFDIVRNPICEQRMSGLERLILTKVEGLEILVTQRFDSYQNALALQAKEYERRLGELNNAHKRADDERAKVVPRELYDSHVKESEARHLDTTKQLTVIQTRAITWGAAWGILITIAGIAMHFLK